NFVGRIVGPAVIRRPVTRQLSHDRLFRHALAGFLSSVEFRLKLLNERVRIDTHPICVGKIEQGTVLDLAVENWLRDGRVIHLGVPVTPESNEVHHDVTAKLVAILEAMRPTRTTASGSSPFT